MYSVSNSEFESMISDSLDSLPVEIQTKMENVELILEDEDVVAPDLLGLYQGVPQPSRGSYYSWVLPDKITIFKKTIENHACDAQHLAQLVQHVVRHEIAHHFGYSDEEINKKTKSI